MCRDFRHAVVYRVVQLFTASIEWKLQFNLHRLPVLDAMTNVDYSQGGLDDPHRCLLLLGAIKPLVQSFQDCPRDPSPAIGPFLTVLWRLQANMYLRHK